MPNSCGRSPYCIGDMELFERAMCRQSEDPQVGTSINLSQNNGTKSESSASYGGPLEKEGLISDLWRTQLSFWTVAICFIFTYFIRRPGIRSMLTAIVGLFVVWIGSVIFGGIVFISYMLHFDALRIFAQQSAKSLVGFASDDRSLSVEERRLVYVTTNSSSNGHYIPRSRSM